jgi:hypothetical protein
MICEKCLEKGDKVQMKLQLVQDTSKGLASPGLAYQDSEGKTHLHDERNFWAIYRCPLDGSHDVRQLQRNGCWCGWVSP